MKFRKHNWAKIRVIGCIISILVFVTFISGCIYSDGEKTYNKSGISFKCPNGWTETRIPTLPNTDGIYEVADINKQIINTEVGRDTVLLVIFRQGAKGKTIEEWKEIIEIPKSDVKSENPIIIDGIQGYQIKGVSKPNTQSPLRDTQDIIFIKNNTFYRLSIVTTQEGSMKYVQADIDMIINSFHVL